MDDRKKEENMGILEFQDVKKDYHLGETKVHALRGVNFAVEKGEFIAVLGTRDRGPHPRLRNVVDQEERASRQDRLDLPGG